MLKKRHGDHEKTIREIRIDQNGVRVGAPQGSVFTLVMPLNDSGPGADSSALKMNSVLSPESEAVHATIPPVLRVALVD